MTVAAFQDTAIMALSWLFICSGSVLVVIAAIGLVRMPDLFTRMHAAGMIDTLAAALLIVGMMLQAGWGLVSLKLLILLALFFITSPTATHAVARAALSAGVEPLMDDGHDVAADVLGDGRNRSAIEGMQAQAIDQARRPKGRWG